MTSAVIRSVVKTVPKASLSLALSSLYSATYLTMPFVKPNVENDSTVVRKFLKFPIKANPSAPIKTAMAFEVTKPTTTLVKTAIELNDAILRSRLLLIYWNILFNINICFGMR